MYRRSLLFGVSAIALAACANGQTAQQVTQNVVTNVGLIANGLVNFLAVSQGLPQATRDSVSGYARDISDIAGQISTAMSQNAALPLIQKISADIDAVASAVQGKLQPGSQGAIILADIREVLPLVQIAVGMVSLAAVPTASPAGAQARLAALPKRT